MDLSLREMNRMHKKSNGQKQHGAALIELSLVVGALLTIFFGGIATSQFLRVSEILSELSKQAANSTFRECISVTTVDDSCVENVALRLNTYAETVLPGSEVIISVYSYDSGSGTVIRNSFYRDSSPTRFNSNFTTTNFASSVPSITNSLTPTMAVAEALYDTAGIWNYPLIQDLFTGGIRETTIY